MHIKANGIKIFRKETKTHSTYQKYYSHDEKHVLDIYDGFYTTLGALGTGQPCKSKSS